MGEFSLSHMLILALILLIFFGPSRLPALGQSIGKAIRGFKEGLNELNAEAKDVGPQNQIKQTQNEPVANESTQAQQTQNSEKTEHKS
jgi:sec-independent protein translocase protein TatA